MSGGSINLVVERVRNIQRIFIPTAAILIAFGRSIIASDIEINVYEYIQHSHEELVPIGFGKTHRKLDISRFKAHWNANELSGWR